MPVPTPRELPAEFLGLVQGLHHVAIAVESLAAARPVWETALGLACAQAEHVPEQKVNVIVAYAGDQRIELVEPAAADSPITRFLATRGPGLHHVALEVRDCAAAIAVLRARGVRMIDEVPRAGSHGTTIAFVHPKAAGGVLIELVESPARGAAHIPK